MAKTQRTVVSVKDNTTQEVFTVESDQLPRKTEPGVYLYLKINQRGLSELQAKGLMLRSTKDLEESFCASTGMSKEGLGSLGKWRLESEKALFSVTVGGAPFLGSSIADEPETNNVTSEGIAVEAVADKTPAVVLPTMSFVPKPVAQPAPLPKAMIPNAIPASVVDEKDKHNIKAIQSALEKGYKSADIIAQLSAKVGADKAVQLFAMAQPLDFA